MFLSERTDWQHVFLLYSTTNIFMTFCKLNVNLLIFAISCSEIHSIKERNVFVSTIQAAQMLILRMFLLKPNCVVLNKVRELFSGTGLSGIAWIWTCVLWDWGFAKRLVIWKMSAIQVQLQGKCADVCIWGVELEEEMSFYLRNKRTIRSFHHTNPVLLLLSASPSPPPAYFKRIRKIRECMIILSHKGNSSSEFFSKSLYLECSSVLSIEMGRNMVLEQRLIPILNAVLEIYGDTVFACQNGR